MTKLQLFSSDRVRIGEALCHKNGKVSMQITESFPGVSSFEEFLANVVQNGLKKKSFVNKGDLRIENVEVIYPTNDEFPVLLRDLINHTRFEGFRIFAIIVPSDRNIEDDEATL